MSFSIPYLLSVITFLPLLGAVAVLLVPNDAGKRWTALGVSLVTFLISLLLLVGWQDGEAGMQFVENVPWLPAYGLHYALGVDGISLWLVLLTTLLMPIAIYFSNLFVHDEIGPYLALMLALQTSMVGVFVALDMVLFFLFFEFSLIPMYFLIGRWGGQNRLYAAVKFFLYTFTGSALAAGPAGAGAGADCLPPGAGCWSGGAPIILVMTERPERPPPHSSPARRRAPATRRSTRGRARCGGLRRAP